LRYWPGIPSLVSLLRTLSDRPNFGSFFPRLRFLENNNLRQDGKKKADLPIVTGLQSRLFELKPFFLTQYSFCLGTNPSNGLAGSDTPIVFH